MGIIWELIKMQSLTLSLRGAKTIISNVSWRKRHNLKVVS